MTGLWKIEREINMKCETCKWDDDEVVLKDCNVVNLSSRTPEQRKADWNWIKGLEKP